MVLTSQKEIALPHDKYLLLQIKRMSDITEQKSQDKSLPSQEEVTSTSGNALPLIQDSKFAKEKFEEHINVHKKQSIQSELKSSDCRRTSSLTKSPSR